MSSEKLPKRKKIDFKSPKLPLIIFIIIFVAVTVVLTVLFWPFIKDLRNPEYRENFSLWVKELGFKGWFILLGLQILQIVVSFIPGGPVELIAGAAYGAWGGLGICLAGCVFSASLIFFTVKKFGLPLVKRFFGEENIKTWGFLKDVRKTTMVVFIVFIIPGTPKDMLTWLGPLSGLSLLQFVVISTFARTPAILCTTIMGDSMIQGNWIVFLMLFFFTALIGMLGILFKDKIVKKFSK